MTTWTFGGSALSSFGRVTLMDNYLDTAERRGENPVIPFRHGSRAVEKYYGERRIMFGLAINVATATLLESTLDSLKRLASIRTQQTLAQTMEDSSVRNISATLDMPFQVSRKSNVFALAVLEFTCAIPYWRSSVQTNGTVTMSAGTVGGTIVNSGTIEENEPVITYIGPLNNPVITNSTNGFSLTYAGSIGGTVVVQTDGTTGEWTATSNGTANVIGNLTHSPGAALMRFNSGGSTNGSNVLSITNAGGTTGQVRFAFYPPYL